MKIFKKIILIVCSLFITLFASSQSDSIVVINKQTGVGKKLVIEGEYILLLENVSIERQDTSSLNYYKEDGHEYYSTCERNKYDGWDFHFFNDGYLDMIMQKKEGKHDGFQVVFFHYSYNPKIMVETIRYRYYLDGKPHGYTKAFDEEGRLTYEANLSDSININYSYGRIYSTIHKR